MYKVSSPSAPSIISLTEEVRYRQSNRQGGALVNFYKKIPSFRTSSKTPSVSAASPHRCSPVRFLQIQSVLSRRDTTRSQQLSHRGRALANLAGKTNVNQNARRTTTVKLLWDVRCYPLRLTRVRSINCVHVLIEEGNNARPRGALRPRWCPSFESTSKRNVTVTTQEHCLRELRALRLLHHILWRKR